jgi:F-type H+-transporting ATPase subunit b
MAEFIGELIAFVVVGFVLWRYVVPPVRTIMRNQQETIHKQVENAEQAHERVQAAELKLQEAVAEARTEAAKIRDTARADAQRIVEEMRAHAEREVERIRQRGVEDLETQRLQMIRELRLRIGELTVSTATELVTQHLSDNRRRASTVDRLLDELESMSARETATVGRGDA